MFRFVISSDGLERRDDALGVLALAAVFGPRHVVVVPLEFHFVSFVELRDGRGIVTEGLSYNHLTCANGSVRHKQESRLVKLNLTLVKRVPRASLSV